MKKTTLTQIKPSPKTQTQASNSLSGVLADLFAARLKSQVYHWNFQGAQFYGIHKSLEEVYKSFDTYIDDLAERIRTIGGRPVSSFAEIIRLSSVENTSADKKFEAPHMLQDMLESLEVLNTKIKKSIQAFQETNDPVTEGMLIDILAKSEKFSWLLSSQESETSMKK